MDQDLSEFKRLEFHQSRIPALDALEAFVPEGVQQDEAITQLTGRTGFSRWRPVEGGHQVLILYEGGPYDATRLTFRKGAWDHQHCKRCIIRIEPMTLCWVSTIGYTILCEDCHRLVVASSGSEPAV